MRLFDRGNTAELPAQIEKPPALNFEEFQKCFVLFSNFRCGTTFLQMSLNKIAGMKARPEPFNEGTRGNVKDSFVEFLEREKISASDLMANGEKVVFSFFAQHLPAQGSDRPMPIDLKYSQSYVLGMHDLMMAPLLLKILIDAKLPVIHLIRRDMIAQSISYLLALKTGRYHRFARASDNAPAAAEQVWMDPEDVLRVALARQRATQIAGEQLTLLGARVLTVFYEDLSGDNWASHFARIFRFLDHYVEVPEAYDPGISRLNSAERVQNIDEIVEFVLMRNPELVSRIPLPA